MEKVATAISLTQLFVNIDDILPSENVVVELLIAFQIKLKNIYIYSSKTCVGPFLYHKGTKWNWATEWAFPKSFTMYF